MLTWTPASSNGLPAALSPCHTHRLPLSEPSSLTHCSRVSSRASIAAVGPQPKRVPCQAERTWLDPKTSLTISASSVAICASCAATSSSVPNAEGSARIDCSRSVAATVRS